MSSRLESLPCDVLQHIAFLTASASILDPPVAISHLSQTCTSIYRSLNLRDAPNLYGHLFYVKFDSPATSQGYRGTITDSALAAELVNRCRLLRRAQRSDCSLDGLLQDLWTALWMILENDGSNIQHLSSVNFTNFILDCSSTILRHSPQACVDHRTDDRQDLKHIIVWLLYLSLHRRVILRMSKQDRDALYSAIFPFVLLSNKVSDTLPSQPPPHLQSSNEFERNPYGPFGAPPDMHIGEPCSPFSATRSSARCALVSAYRKFSKPALPDASTAAINLISVIYEVTPIKVPLHFPETRAIANASQRSGPTQEDYRIFAAYQTHLFADLVSEDSTSSPPLLLSSPNVGRTAYDSLFRDLLQISETDSDVLNYLPGTLSGLWEGIYRTINVPNLDGTPSQSVESSVASVMFMKPMQCEIEEYICTTQSSSMKNEVLPYDALVSSLDASDNELLIDGQTYQKYHQPSQSILKSNPLYDVILLGKTLEDHSHAWGGYKFSGRVHKDGSIVLRREAKTSSSHQSEGVWIFIGRLQSPAMIIGRWRITGALNGASLDHGVFSMGRRRQ
ncbi:hypothetical protein BDN70DRAFT_917867 [Pholiota conissans]|uniref:F-box domain-containing protein n=1 Tax=Pholiota conissans TaxID=109636 RepID=A0A9P5ZAL2_9AGAR|nr:hypothetical protein BDN70DRAFT_917867 [Pholiota conissans]